MKAIEYQPQTAATTLRLIAEGIDPWLAIGQFLDDWRRLRAKERMPLIRDPLREVPSGFHRWAAFLAAAVDWLCAQDNITAPSWVGEDRYRLREPWFLYPGWRLRMWQLVETPAPFKMRNIFGGDRILSRV